MEILAVWIDRRPRVRVRAQLKPVPLDLLRIAKLRFETLKDRLLLIAHGTDVIAPHADAYGRWRAHLVELLVSWLDWSQGATTYGLMAVASHSPSRAS